MKKTISAVRYGIDTLKVSPNAMFGLIESSKGYEGSDYQRWLASKIIEIAENDGVGFSQLLVKKFSIISAIIEDANSLIKEDWLNCFRSILEEKGSVHSINFPEIKEVDEVGDWYEGLDCLGNYEFSESELSACGLYDELSEHKNICLVGILSDEPCKKNNSLALSAKQLGIQCKNLGSLLLYRMCNLVDSWELGSEFSFAFLCKASYLYNRDNIGIMQYFLSYFNYNGVVVNAADLYEEGYDEDDYVFVVCTSKEGSSQYDHFEFGNDVEWLSDDLLVKDIEEGYLGRKLRYSRSSDSEFDLLSEESANAGEDVVQAYIKSSYGSFSVTSKPVDNSLFVTENNYIEAITYYGVSLSLQSGGRVVKVPRLLTGSNGFLKLFYNCVPLFLFSENSDFEYDSPYGLGSDLVKKLLDDGEVYFSYEAKELVSICKGFVEYLNEEASFSELRKSANNPDLNSAYVSALIGLKEYVRSLYENEVE